MRAFVYTDRSLAGFAGQFVWLSINTENSANAAFLKKYPIPALPTLLVLDAQHDAIAFRYVGGATVTQLRKMLDDTDRSFRTKTQADADKLVAAADKLASDGKHGEAVKSYEAAMKTAPKTWTKLGRTAESMLFSMSMAEMNDRCAASAVALYPRLAKTSSAANVASTGLSCALELDAGDAKNAALVAKLEEATKDTLVNKKLDLSGDDRSGLYIALIDARDHAKDEAGQRKLTEEWASFLEGEASRAKTNEQRAVYDSHRLSAYLSLGTPEKAVAMLQQSEKDFPDDYNPPARLTAAYRAMKRYDDALAANERALARAYGPRKIGIYTTRADILAEMGRKDDAKKVIADAMEFVKTLPEDDRRSKRIEALQKKLEKLN